MRLIWSVRTVVFAVLIGLAFHDLAAQDVWRISADRIDPNDYAGVMVANGTIGVVSSPHPFQVREIVLAGAYDKYGRGKVSNMIRSFNFLGAFVEVNRHRIGSGNVSNVKQSLDMRSAAFTARFDFENKATVEVTYRALRHLPFCVLMEVAITARQDVRINSGSVVEAPDALRNVRNTFNQIAVPGGQLPLLSSSALSPSGQIEVCAATSLLFTGPVPDIIYESPDANLHQVRFEKEMKRGEVMRFAVVGATLTSTHHSDPGPEAERLAIFARQQGLDRLIAMHNAKWEQLWKSDIILEGNNDLQRDVHSMLYHLYSSVGEDTGFSLSPMGLSGTGYNGHVFWDTEIWMYPALLVLHPVLAKNIVEYRFQRLGQAQSNAQRHGYKGAMFPWESALSGDEETPTWALSGPFEHHITACVALATWQYYTVTRDTAWLRTRGWPILQATAEFWMSRVELNQDGMYDVLNVVGADEWAENVDNDAWTNAAAKANLNYAAQASKVLFGIEQNGWRHVAERIRILKFSDGTTREHATYNGEPVKQADVNLLAYPLKEITNPVDIRRDIAYYKSRIPEKATPAMTKAIFALLYARLGDSKAATAMLDASYQQNKLKPFGVLAETEGGYNHYFLTGAGGVLQSLIFGFGGLDLSDDGLIRKSSIPPLTCKSITIRLAHETAQQAK